MKRGEIIWRLRQAALLLALFALTFKAALPPGYMLDARGGQMVVALCSSDPSATAIIDLAGESDKPAPQHDQSSAPCPYTVAAVAGTLTAEVGVAHSQAQSFAALRGVNVAYSFRGLAAPPPWATGPPLSI